MVVLSDKLSFNATQTDTQTILQALVIKNYFQRLIQQGLMKPENNPCVCLQLLKPESITHYELSLT